MSKGVFLCTKTVKRDVDALFCVCTGNENDVFIILTVNGKFGFCHHRLLERRVFGQARHFLAVVLATHGQRQPRNRLENFSTAFLTLLVAAQNLFMVLGEPTNFGRRIRAQDGALQLDLLTGSSRHDRVVAVRLGDLIANAMHVDRRRTFCNRNQSY